ncbi:hypothetical protein BH11BAC1_BH11BAC1_07680 [soil metagenome]
MKRLLNLFFLFIFSGGFAQTTLINPLTNGGFETGNTFPLNGWTVVNGAQVNQWYCGTGATGYTGARCAHVGTAAANNNYNPNISSVVHFYRDVVFPAGQQFITLTFSWKGYGESGYDYLQAFLVGTGTTPVAGTQLFTGYLGPAYGSQTTWQTATISLPCNTAGTTKRIIFQWTNDNIIGTNPAIAIDNISLISNVTAGSCASLLGTGVTNVASLPYNSGAGTTCGAGDDLTINNSSVCGDPYYTTSEDKVWVFTPATSGSINISLSSPSGFDTGLMLYSGCPVSACAAAATCVGYTQDYYGDKSMCVSVVAGTTYYLVLDGYYTCNPYNNLSISAPAGIPAGTTCANPVNITLPYSATAQTTSCFGNDYSNLTIGSCGSLYESGEDKVYKLVVASSQCIGISITNASTTSVGFQVYQNCPGGGGTCIGSNGGSNPLGGSVVLPSAGTYYIIVDTWASPTFVNYDIAITSFGGGPANDLPCNATLLNLSAITNGDNSCSGGTGEPAGGSCWYNGSLNTVWYKVVCPASGQLRIKTQTGSLINTQIDVFSGACGSLTTVSGGCNVNSTFSCNGALYSELLLTGLIAGNTYFIRVDGYSSYTGTFTILAMDGSLPPPPTVQDCDGAIGVCQTVITQAQSFFGCGSTNEIVQCPAVSNPCTNVSSANMGCMLANPAELNASWYLINITSNGSLRWTCTQGTSGFYDWSLYNITSNSCADIRNNILAPVRCNWNSSSTSPTGMEATLPAGGVAGNFESPLAVTAGQKFVLVMSNFSGTTGGYTMNFGNSTCGIGSPPTVTWSGTTNSSWTVATNWGSCSPPVCGINANIAPAAIQPVITANQTVKDLMIMPGASLTLNAGVTLTVCGNYSNFGTLIASPTSTMLFNNASVAQTLNGAMTASNAVGNLTITKTGGTATLNADLDMSGSFTTSNNTSVFNSGGRYIKLAGHFLNSTAGTTFTNSGVTGTLEFNGSVAQNYSPGGNLTLNNVKMNHLSTGVTLVGNNMILGTSGVLTLTNGKIITNAFEVTQNNTAPASVTPGNVNSFVQGYLRRFLNGSVGSYDFPVGHSVKGYQRANINFTSTTSIPNLLANFNTYGALPNGPVSAECPNNNYNLMSVLDNGYWTINASSNPTSGNYNITLYNTNYTPSGAGWTVIKSPTAPPTAGTWALGGVCVPASTMPQTMRNGMNGFSSFGVGVSNNPLPVELLNFSGEPAGNFNILDWTTASEINSDYFTIERSRDGNDFEIVGTSKAAGNSVSVLHYQLEDQHPFYGKTFYRLRQTDFDGRFSFSAIIAISNSFEKISISNLHPNPTTGAFEFDFYNEQNTSICIAVADVLGRELRREVLSVEKGTNHFNATLDDLPAGVYHIILTDIESDFSVVKKIVRYY